MKLLSLFALFVNCSIITVPALAQDAIRPNPQVEAKAAQALMDVETQLKASSVKYVRGMTSLDNDNEAIQNLALSLARLGRTEAALQATKLMSIKEATVSNGAPWTREEILHLSARRSAALGNLKNVIRLIPQIKDASARADALLLLAQAYLREGNNLAAQKVLFKVSPLVTDRAAATSYTAFLFARSGEIDAAKRLFTRAEKVLPPVQVPQDPQNTGMRISYLEALSMRSSLADYLLSAGFVDDWLQFIEYQPKLHDVIKYRALERLIKFHRTDVAIHVARKVGQRRQLLYFTGIAMQIAEKQPQQALSLLDEASENLTLSRDKLRQHPPNKKAFRKAQSEMDVIFAVSYHLTGKEDAAQGWMQKAVKDASPQQAALLQVQYSLTPLIMATNTHSKSTFPATELSKINNEIKSYLPLIRNSDEGFNYLRQLVKAQIKAGQIYDARSNIESMEEYALSQINTAKETDDFADALDVARLWKRIKDQDRCHKMLAAVFNAPVKIEDFAKIDRANYFIFRGFVDEGLQFIQSLPKDQRKSNMEFSPSINYMLARAHPNRFPAQVLLQGKKPLEQLKALNQYVSGLTRDVFKPRQGQSFGLYVGGGYSSGG